MAELKDLTLSREQMTIALLGVEGAMYFWSQVRFPDSRHNEEDYGIEDENERLVRKALHPENDRRPLFSEIATDRLADLLYASAIQVQEEHRADPNHQMVQSCAFQHYCMMVAFEIAGQKGMEREVRDGPAKPLDQFIERMRLERKRAGDSTQWRTPDGGTDRQHASAVAASRMYQQILSNLSELGPEIAIAVERSKMPQYAKAHVTRQKSAPFKGIDVSGR